MSSEELIGWRNLGQSGLKVSNIIVGCMSYGDKKWVDWALDDEEQIFKILKRAYDIGLRTFDTADLYSNGLSETILGRFLQKFNIPRDKVVIMTKVWAPADESYGSGFNVLDSSLYKPIDTLNFENNKGLSRKHILNAAENSVRRLGTHIDVYQIHRSDAGTPKAETMRALNDVVEKGLATYIGASSMRAVDFVEYQHVAEVNKWHKFINMQSLYNLLNRGDEDEMNYYCDKTGVGLTPWSPIQQGLLARPLASEIEKESARANSKWSPTYLAGPVTAADKEIIKRVEKIAEDKNTTMAAVSTAWVISKGAFPIVGLNSEKRVDDALEASKLKLSEEDIKFLEEPYQQKSRHL